MTAKIQPDGSDRAMRTHSFAVLERLVNAYTQFDRVIGGYLPKDGTAKQETIDAATNLGLRLEDARAHIKKMRAQSA